MLMIAAAASMIALSYSAVPTALIRSRNYVRSRRRPDSRILCLTFDDGPTSEYTPELLDLLAEHGVKATFFVTAESALRNPRVVRRIVREGHTAALHGLRHGCPLFEGIGRTGRDLRKALSIMDLLGVKIRYFRPPWGTFNLALLAAIREAGLRPVLWDVMVGDWSKNATIPKLVDRLSARAERSSVICLHDGRGADGAPAKTIGALRIMLPLWKSEGYSFVTIEEYYGKINDREKDHDTRRRHGGDLGRCGADHIEKDRSDGSL